MDGIYNIQCDGRQKTIVVNFGLLLLNKHCERATERGNQNFHLYQSVTHSFRHVIAIIDESHLVVFDDKPEEPIFAFALFYESKSFF